jgi:cell division protein FtsB
VYPLVATAGTRSPVLCDFIVSVKIVLRFYIQRGLMAVSMLFSFTDFALLNLQLDELSSALDALEQKNDHINAQLMKLLESNRETRQLFQKNLTDEQKSDPQI